MTASATKEHITLRIEVHDAPGSVMSGTVKRYPSAQIDSVVVEVQSV